MTLRRHFAWAPGGRVLSFLDTLRRRDRAACVGGASALRAWLGRPPVAPTVLVVGRSTRVPRDLLGSVELRTGRAPRVEVAEGVPLEGRLHALLRELEGRERTPDAELLAEAAASLEDAEIAELSRRARARCSAGVARAVHLVRATGRAELVARPASKPVWWRPDGPRCGALDGPSGVRVNGPDGIERAGAPLDWVDAWLASAPRPARELLALAHHGLGLDPALAEHVCGASAARALAWLVSRGLLVSRAGSLRAVAPVGAVSRADDARVGDATRRALAWLDAHRDPLRRAEAVDVRVRARHADAAARAIEEGPSLVERGEIERLERWLTVIEREDPREAGRLRARVLERAGKLHEALSFVRAALAADAHDAVLTLERARLAWRVGNRSEAMASLRTLGRRALPLAVEVDVEVLRASLASERGEPEAARRHLGRARAVAEQSGDGEALAQVLRRLGTLEARAGKPRRAAGAYRAALGALARVARIRDASLETVLVANLATTESWLGNHDEAERLYRVALERRRDRPIERLNTLAALALLGAARGERSAEGAFGPLVEEAERLGDPRLRAELATYRTEELAAERRLAEAERALALAHVALAELGGAELVLEAMADVAEGLVRARRGDRSCLVALERALDALTSAGARYHAARSAREGATAALWLGDRARALALVERSVSLSVEGGFDLGNPARHAGALVLGALEGASEVRAHVGEQLARAGELRLLAWLRHEGLGELATRWAVSRTRTRGGGAVLASGPSGPRALLDTELEALRRDRSIVVLDRVLHRLHVGGAPPRDLGRMRLVEPLLAHLAAVRPGVARLDELARVVWGQRSSRSVRTAITTSIARLRRLLGASLTLHTTGAGEARAYSIAPTAPLWVVEAPPRAEP